MSFRFMRVLVFFDLPTLTKADRRAYTHFRNLLITSGFIMIQESVYSKLALNKTSADSIKELIRKKKPKKGNIQMLTITEKQYMGIEYVLGEYSSNVISSLDRYIEL
jgi:CRISPR-associated protein Cas2